MKTHFLKQLSKSITFIICILFSVTSCDKNSLIEAEPELPQHTVTYLAGEGSGTIPTQKVAEGKTFVLASANGLVAPNGKEFSCWMNTTGARYQPGDTCIMEKYNITFTAQWEKSGQTEISYDFTPTASIDGYDYVDLGLSVMWATCNVGATSIENCGDYFAWQETTPVNEFTYVNYNLYFNPCNQNNILSSCYDVARMNWGKNWRMPTYEEQKELTTNCIWTWADDFQGKGISGCIIKSKTSNKAIFLPVTGYKRHEDYTLINADRGYYWSSYAGPGDLWKGLLSVIDLTFYQGLNLTYGGTWSANHRADGVPVRAVVGRAEEYIPEGPFPIDNSETTQQGVSVSGKKDGYTYVDLGLPSRTLWATYNVGATKPSDYGNYYAWGEIQPKNLYDETNYIFYAGVNGNWNKYSKYTWSTAHHGTIDGKLTLESGDDAATQNMSNGWCMPTKEQFEELCLYVKWNTSSNGWLGTSKINGHTIFLPCAGWEYGTNPNSHLNAWYWSSCLTDFKNSGSDYYAYILIDSNTGLEVKDARRVQGLPVRGVVK